MEPTTALRAAQPISALALPKSIVFVGAMEVLQRVRHIWKWVSTVSMFLNYDDNYRPTNVNWDFGKRIAAGGISWAVGRNNPIAQSFASVVFLGYSGIRYRDAKAYSSQAWNSWIKYAIKGDYYASIHVDRAPLLEKILGPSAAFWLQYRVESLKLRMQKIAVETFAMIAASWMTVMAAGDLYDALCYCLRFKESAEPLLKLPEGFYTIMEEVAQSKESFNNWVDTNEPMITASINFMRLPFTTRNFRDFTGSAIENVGGAYNLGKKVVKVVDATVWGTLQDGIFTAWQLGPGLLTGYTPDWMVRRE